MKAQASASSRVLDQYRPGAARATHIGWLMTARSRAAPMGNCDSRCAVRPSALPFHHAQSLHQSGLRSA
jgi:hypothetical protein